MTAAMTIQAAQCVNSDLAYIQTTALATVALVVVTIIMVALQIYSTKRTVRVQLSMQLKEQYDSIQMRANRKALAKLLLLEESLSSTVSEPILDLLDSIADLHNRKFLDSSLVGNAFSVPIRYWWSALEEHVKKMRGEYHDDTLWKPLENLAKVYNDAVLTKRRTPAITKKDLHVFLTSEAE
jgi:hypothetical protein